MVCLTIRSGRDGRFLARVVDQGGRPFVLDYGDTRVIEDLVQRITRGFTMIRQGRLLHVHPGDEDLLVQLASFYALEGALVAYEEPTWSGRELAVQRRPRVVRSASAQHDAAAPQGSQIDEDDEPTETIALSDLQDVTTSLTAVASPHDPAQPSPAPHVPTAPRPAPDEEENEAAAADDAGESLLPRVPFLGDGQKQKG